MRRVENLAVAHRKERPAQGETKAGRVVRITIKLGQHSIEIRIPHSVECGASEFGTVPVSELKSKWCAYAPFGLHLAMLAPPKKRAANRRRKAKERARRKNGLHRCELWLSANAYEGLLQQLIMTGALSDSQANDHHRFELAFTALVEAQGVRWTR